MTETVQELLDSITAVRGDIISISESMRQRYLEYNRNQFIIRDQIDDLNAILVFQINEMSVPEQLKSQLLTQCYELLDQRRTHQKYWSFIMSEEETSNQYRLQIGDEELKYLLLKEEGYKLDDEYHARNKAKVEVPADHNEFEKNDVQSQ